MSYKDKEKLIPHIIMWLLGAVAVIWGRTWLFYLGVSLLVIDFFILIAMAGLGKFEKKISSFLFLPVPLLLLIYGYLRLSGKIIFSVMFAALCLAGYAQSETDLISGGDALNHDKGDYNIAAEKYWKAVVKYTSQKAVVKLSEFYKNQKDWFQRDYGYDWQIPRKYIQAAADAFYPQSKAEFVNTDFIVIASEDAIIGQAIWNLKKVDFAENQGLRHDGYTRFPGKNLCGIAIDIVKKDIKIAGKRGLFTARSRYFDDIGNVAVVDRDTAEHQFTFTDNPRTEWMVYVRCPADKNLLIPFADFHRYLYQEKMAAFISICRKMAAKSIKVYYEKTDNSGRSVSVRVNGAVSSYGDAKTQIDIAKYTNREENSQANYEFERAIKTQELSDYEKDWLKSEPTWRAIYDSRHKGRAINPVSKFDAVFTYSDSYKVDINASVKFNQACWKIGVDSDIKTENFVAVKWKMKVDFFTVIF